MGVVRRIVIRLEVKCGIELTFESGSTVFSLVGCPSSFAVDLENRFEE